jgi:FixJ family two-component response regulator
MDFRRNELKQTDVVQTSRRPLVAQGRQSKQIAYDIGIAEATVKVHRCRAMQKMQAGSLPELGRLADKLKLVPDGAASLLGRSFRYAT